MYTFELHSSPVNIYMSKHFLLVCLTSVLSSTTCCVSWATSDWSTNSTNGCTLQPDLSNATPSLSTLAEFSCWCVLSHSPRISLTIFIVLFRLFIRHWRIFANGNPNSKPQLGILIRDMVWNCIEKLLCCLELFHAQKDAGVIFS